MNNTIINYEYSTTIIIMYHITANYEFGLTLINITAFIYALTRLIIERRININWGLSTTIESGRFLDFAKFCAGFLSAKSLVSHLAFDSAV